jgi:FtsP/CotA-like multicopper oxidase with cupredoxin domain
MYSGEVVRLRVLNATARTQMPFQIENHELSLIALDAIALPAVRTTQVLNLAAGGRGDVMVQAGAPGTYTIFRRRDPDSANNNDPDVPLATLVVLPAVLKMSLPTGVLPTHASLPDIRDSELTAPERVLTFAVSGTGGPPGGFGNFTVNGVRFDPKVVNVTVPLGAVEQWRLVNTSNVSHPFHIHVNDFQVIAINDQPLPVPEWHDTISIPPARNGVPGSVTFRTRFLDFKGMYVFHCHILVHEDLGMMQIVNVI